MANAASAPRTQAMRVKMRCGRERKPPPLGEGRSARVGGPGGGDSVAADEAAPAAPPRFAFGDPTLPLEAPLQGRVVKPASLGTNPTFVITCLCFQCREDLHLSPLAIRAFTPVFDGLWRGRNERVFRTHSG